jgi:hypothetical protein
MNRDRFNEKYRAVVHSQQEMDRKWRCYLLEQEQMSLLERSRNFSTPGVASGNSLPVNAIEFTVNTSDSLFFRFSFTSTGEPIEFTIDWGDGAVHNDSGNGGYYDENHTYDEVKDYTVRVSFDDPLKILQLEFPGDGDAPIKSIIGLQNLSSLQEFRADYNALETLDFSGLINLTYVDASDCDLVDSNTPSLREVNLSGCNSLEDLRLDGSDFSGGVPKLNDLIKLSWLDLDQCDITGTIDLSDLHRLRGFDLSGNDMLTEVSISSSQSLGDGQSIYLNDCALSQESVDSILVALSKNPVEGGYVDLSGGTNALTGTEAKGILESNGWEVIVNEPLPANVSIDASTDFDIVGDFTIEMFIKMNNLDGYPRPYSFGTYPAANAISIEGGQLYFWANNESLINGTFLPNIGQWYHIAIEGKVDTVYMFIDGVMVSNSPYSGSISSQGLPLTIGYGNEPNSALNGSMTNFRWTDYAMYSADGFTVPTAPLTAHPNTKLLIFQGTTLEQQLTDNSGNDHDGTGDNLTYNPDNPFGGIRGSILVGDPTTSYPYLLAISETSPVQACGRIGNSETLFYLNDYPVLGKFIYTDPALSIPAQNGWYAYIDTAYQVSDGQIIELQSCGV